MSNGKYKVPVWLTIYRWCCNPLDFQRITSKEAVEKCRKGCVCFYNAIKISGFLQ